MDDKMKAIIYHKYGSPDVLGLKEVEKPTPKDDEVLIKVCAASVNPLDWHFVRGTPYFVRIIAGLLQPKDTRLGVDVAGQVESVGRNVTQFKPGDNVFGTCRGAFAEYACASESALVIKPDTVTFEQAASVPVAASTALQGLRDKGRIQPEQKVLVNGASGGVGTFAVQIAKLFKAEVTAVCSPRKMNIARLIGADHVIDYTKEDFTQDGKCYDLIIAANGYHSISDYKRSLGRNGIYVMIGGSGAQMFQALFLGPLVSITGSKKMGGMMAVVNKKDLIFLKGLIEAGKVKPVIDRHYPLSDVAQAIRYLEEGHAQGKVVITI